MGKNSLNDIDYNNSKYIIINELINNKTYASLFRYNKNKTNLTRISESYPSILSDKQNTHISINMLDNKNCYIAMTKNISKDDKEVMNNLYNWYTDTDLDHLILIENNVSAVFKYDEEKKKLVRISKYFINGYIAKLDILSCDNLFVITMMKEIKSTNDDEYVIKKYKAIFYFDNDNNKFFQISDLFGFYSLMYLCNKKTDIINVFSTDNRFNQLIRYNPTKNNFDIISDKYNNIDARLLIRGKSNYFIANSIKSSQLKKCIMKFDKETNKVTRVTKWFNDCHINISKIDKTKTFQITFYNYKNNNDNSNSNKISIYSIDDDIKPIFEI